MRIPFISALVGIIAGLFGRKRPQVMTKRSFLLASPTEKTRNKVAKRKRITYQRKLRRKFAANSLARFGYDEAVNKKTLVHFRSPEMRRRMRNARKLERQQAAR